MGAKVEALLPRVYMMEMEVENATVVPADRAPTPRFLYQDASDLLLPARYGLSDTSLAAPAMPTPTCAVQSELRHTVAAAST